MNISYKKLWKLLIDNEMKKADLARAAGISQYAMTQLSKNAPVSLKVLEDICMVFHCDIGDVMEFVPDDK